MWTLAIAPALAQTHIPNEMGEVGAVRTWRAPLCGAGVAPAWALSSSRVIAALGGAPGWGRATSRMEGAQSLLLDVRVLVAQGRLGPGDSWEEGWAVGEHSGP